ncbi:MAG TPA: LptA/OstA family protein, partial [Candidatus Acidoferrales bacterium]|nr:LptA/OstA family protein [Candidatus Acidoferrales bacterium]
IDLRDGAKKGAGDAAGMHFETSDISFDRDSGKVSTKNAVTLRFPGGAGQATGVVYDPQSEDVKLENNVQLKMTPANSRALPVNLTGSALEFRRSDGTMRLSGPVRAQQGQRILTAGALEVDLDAQMHPRAVLASGEPRMTATDARGEILLAANQMEGSFASGVIHKIVADGNVRGDEHSTNGVNHISAEHVELMLVAKDGSSEPREVLARGNVRVAMQQGAAKRNLRTAALQVDFGPGALQHAVRVASAETLAPAKIVTSQPGETDTIQGAKLKAAFDARGQLTELRGASGVKVVHQEGAKPPQVTTAQNLKATFGAGGEWNTIDESERVKFEQAGRNGQAEQAHISRAANRLTLIGSASIADPTSRLSAARIEINQKTGNIRASGNVVVSYAGNTSSGKALNAGAANISADQMNGSSVPGHAVFSGHVKFWQDGDVLQAQAIELWRGENRAEASGNVVGAFAETPPNAAKAKSKVSAPTVWQVRAPKAVYSGNIAKAGEMVSGKVELTGGVTARSGQGSIASRTLTLYLSGAGGQQEKLQSAIAEGGVRIEQKGRIGTAERGEYIARDGKFVLSGGQPTLSDGSGNTTTGRELTFFLASDTILVDSQKGPRTITKHRVE